MMFNLFHEICTNGASVFLDCVSGKCRYAFLVDRMEAKLENPRRSSNLRLRLTFLAKEYEIVALPPQDAVLLIFAAVESCRET